MGSTVKTKLGKEGILDGKLEDKWWVHSKTPLSPCRCRAWASQCTPTLRSRPSSATTSSWSRAKSDFRLILKMFLKIFLKTFFSNVFQMFLKIFLKTFPF